jgi:hypothetical protein
LLSLAAALVFVLGVADSAEAANPLKPNKFKFDPSIGYILVRVGPTDKGNAPPVYFARLDDSGKKTVWSFGSGLINSKKVRDAAMVWGSDHFGTDGKTSLYLVPVNPGRWVVGGAGGTTMSLGSYGFDVKAGEITYVGTVLTGREDGKSEVPEIAATKLSKDLVEFGTLMNIVMSDAIVVTPAAEADPLPAQINAHPVVRAELIPDVRFNNFLAALVNRAVGLPPLGHQDPKGSYEWQKTAIAPGAVAPEQGSAARK